MPNSVNQSNMYSAPLMKLSLMAIAEHLPQLSCWNKGGEYSLLLFPPKMANLETISAVSLQRHLAIQSHCNFENV